MTSDGGYVLATDPDDAERRRMALLFAYHGASTIEALQASGVANGWRCLEVGAGGGDITAWLAQHVAPDGHVVAVDLETRWIEPLASDVVTVHRGDFTQLELDHGSFDLLVTQMVLLHLPHPHTAVERFTQLVRPDGQIVIHDTDFTPVALAGASEAEAAGLAVMSEVMQAGRVDLALGPKVAPMLEAAGATVEDVRVQPSGSPADERAAKEITAITLERFRNRTATPEEAIDAALVALRDDRRRFTGPTRWTVRARVTGTHAR